MDNIPKEYLNVDILGEMLKTYNSETEFGKYNLNQEKLYLHQKQNYIYNGHFLCILNSVPLFLLEYYQEDFWDRVTVV